jgi:hypothetical protein
MPTPISVRLAALPALQSSALPLTLFRHVVTCFPHFCRC